MSRYTEAKARRHEIQLLLMQIRYAPTKATVEYLENYMGRRLKELEDQTLVGAFDA